MRGWIIRVIIPFWISLYIALFRVFSGALFVSLVVYFGALKGALILIFVFGIWGTIFYLVLLETDSVENIREKISSLLMRKPSKMKDWLRNKFFIPGEPAYLSPLLIVLTFVIESPLLGAFIIRLGYPKQYRLRGLFWIWVGAVAEVTTWFLPVYGGGISIIKGILAIFQ